MSYRFEFKIVLKADNAEVACRFRDVVEDFIATHFTKEVYEATSTVQPSLDEFARDSASMKYVRWTTAWALFWAGHVVSRPMNIWRLAVVLYPIYNRLMGWSSEVQGPGDFGPWQHVGKSGE